MHAVPGFWKQKADACSKDGSSSSVRFDRYQLQDLASRRFQPLHIEKLDLALPHWCMLEI